eukprot:550692_1
MSALFNHAKRCSTMLNVSRYSYTKCTASSFISHYRSFTTPTGLSREEAVSSLEIFEFMNVIFNKGKGGGVDAKSLTDGAKLRQVFDRIDSDDSGELDEDEFRTAALVCSMGISDNQISEVFQSLDTDNNGTISFNEFTTAIGQLSINSDEFANSDKDIQNIIEKWDTYMNGNPDAAQMFADILLQSKELNSLANVEPERQAPMIFGMVANTFRALTNLEKLKSHLEKEGTRHFGRFAMEPRHVKICGKALFETLPAILGEAYDETTQQDFEKYWSIIEESLIKGMNKKTW